VSAPATTLRYVDDDVVQRVLAGVLALDLDADYWERQGAMMALLLSGHPQGEQTVTR